MARKNIKVPEDLFHALRDDKDDQQSWPHYLEKQCLHDGDPIPPGLDELAAATPEEVEQLKESLRDELDKIPERTADKLEGRMR